VCVCVCQMYKANTCEKWQHMERLGLSCTLSSGRSPLETQYQRGVFVTHTHTFRHSSSAIVSMANFFFSPLKKNTLILAPVFH